MKSEVYSFYSILLLIFKPLQTSTVSLKKAERATFVLPYSTSFFVPNGTYRLRVLAVGGGGGGCGGIKQGRGGSGEAVVNIIQLTGPKTVNVSVGKAGQGARGHTVKSDSNGTPSQFGNCLTAAGGQGCTRDLLEQSLMKLSGFRLLRNKCITKGKDGVDSVLPTSTVEGGKGGILINGTGPLADPGGGNISAAGGVGYGAGGGAGGAVYFDNGPLIYSGGNGTDGVVYVEMVDPACSHPADIIFAVESRRSATEFDLQLNYVKKMVTNLKISRDHTRVALISYAHEVHLKFGFNDFLDSDSLVQGLSEIKNDFNRSTEVKFSSVYETALIAFYESRPTAAKAIVLLTFAKNVTHSSVMENLLSNMKIQGISISLVAMRNKTNLSNLVSLVEHEHSIYTGTLTETIPWIVDGICLDSHSKKTGKYIVNPTSTLSPSAMTQNFNSSVAIVIQPTSSFSDSQMKTTGTITVVPTLTLSSSTVPQNISSSVTMITQSSPSFVFTTSAPVASTEHHSPSPTKTTTSSASLTPSVSKQDTKYKTVQELEKDLDAFLSFNVTTISVDYLSEAQTYVSLAGDLLSESHRIPNASERGIQFKLLKRVEDIGLTVAEQMKPIKEEGYKAVALSSGKVEMAVASVNISQMEQLRFPDIIGDDFGNNSFHHFDKVLLPQAAFAPNKTELGQVVWMTFDALTAMNATDYVIGSRIMNIIAKPSNKEEFEKPVKMTFWVPKAIRIDMENECMFWDQNNTEKNGVWSSDGCQVVQRNHSTIMCHCNHLTSFAVLIKVTHHKPKQEHELPLSIITCVGCGLSILGCILTLFTYAFLPSLRSQRQFIHMNLVIAILLAQVLFLVAAFGVRPGTSQVACYATSVGLFFFFLCVFSWMLAEGLHIYFMVIRVFGSGRGRNLYYSLIGWGFPFAITAIVVSIFQSRLLSRVICWLSVETGAIWSFVGPAVFVMLVNLIILIMVMRVTSKMLNEESPSSVRSLAKAFVTLLPILGLTWVFGLLSVNNSYIVFEYLFAVFNSLQGLLIFLFFCLRNTEVRREFKRKLRNLEAKRHPNSLSNPSSTPRNPPAEVKCKDSQTRQDKTTQELHYFETKL